MRRRGRADGLRRLAVRLGSAVLTAAVAACGAEDGARGPRLAGATGVAPAAAAAGDRIPRLVAVVAPSVVAVQTDGGEGSGVVWDGEGIVVSNFHVVQGAERVRVRLADGDLVDARVLAGDRVTDLAVLAVEREGLPSARFADDLPAVGELAVALGNPLGFENSATAGIVSGVDRSIPGGGQSLAGLIQTDAPISPGNSGGALVDGRGRVVGINVAYLPPSGTGAVSIGFAIPAPVVRDVVGDLLRDGRVQHAYLGVELAPLTPAVGRRLGTAVEQGAIVTSLAPGGPAARAGLRPGDVLVGLAGRPIAAVEDVYAVLRGHDPGATVSAVAVRQGRRLERTLTLGRRPAPGRLPGG